MPPSHLSQAALSHANQPRHDLSGLCFISSLFICILILRVSLKAKRYDFGVVPKDRFSACHLFKKSCDIGSELATVSDNSQFSVDGANATKRAVKLHS